MLRKIKTKTMKKLYILSLTTTYPENNNPTKGSFVHLLNKEFVKQNCRVVTITPHIQHSSTKEIMDNVETIRFRYFVEKYEKFEGGIAESITKSKLNILKTGVMILFFLGNSLKFCIKEKPDIIHAHWAFPSAFIGYLLAKLFRKKLFITVYAAEFAILQKKFKFLKSLIRNIFDTSTGVIGITTFATKKAIEFGALPDKVRVIRPIPNYVKLQHDENEKSEFRDQISKPNQKIILFVGRFIEHKGVSYLIRSLEKLPNKDVKLVIAGGGPQYQELVELTKQIKKQEQVTFIKNPTDQKLGLLYQIADVFVLPSIDDSRGDTEGLGLVMMEAMKCRVPVIATNVGGAKDVIRDMHNGLLVNQKDPDSIAKAIKRILDDQQLTNQIIKNSQETIEEYSPQKIAKQHIDLFLGKS